MSRSYRIALTATPPSVRIGSGLAAFFLLTANLRPALTGVGPVLDAIRSGLGLSGATAGLLTTLPLLIFAGLSPCAHLARLFGVERTLAGCLALIAVGIALRSEGSLAALFAGTAIFSTGIAIANVLAPSVIKRDFPESVAALTTAYVMVMSLSGALATGLAAPLAAALVGGWRGSLAIWSAPAALALVFWLAKTRTAAFSAHEGAAPATNAVVPAKPIWHSAGAWQVTAFMGLQFLIYFVTIGWMPPYLIANGETATAAGWTLMLYQLVSFAVGLVAPALLRRGSDQRALAVTASLVTALCILGLLVAPALAGLWLAICGASFGISYILAFALIGMRTADHARAASLSMMAQAVAYLIAAAGPFAFGLIHDAASGWRLPMLSLLAVAVIQAAVGLGAGRPGQV